MKIREKSKVDSDCYSVNDFSFCKTHYAVYFSRFCPEKKHPEISFSSDRRRRVLFTVIVIYISL